MEKGARNKIKVTLVLFGFLAVLAFTFVGYNIERNVRSKKTTTQSCELIREAIRTDYAVEPLRPVYEGDAARVHEALNAGLEAQCKAALDHLSFYRINLFGVVEVPRDHAREAELMRIFDQADRHCPESFAAALEGMPGEQTHERSLEIGRTMCERITHNVRGIASIPSAEYGAWDWAARVNALAHDVILVQQGYSATPDGAEPRQAPSPY